MKPNAEFAALQPSRHHRKCGRVVIQQRSRFACSYHSGAGWFVSTSLSR